LGGVAGSVMNLYVAAFWLRKPAERLGAAVKRGQWVLGFGPSGTAFVGFLACSGPTTVQCRLSC
jgi:hypothetical protein